MWARGPQLLDPEKISSMPEVRCASLVRTRTTLPRSFTWSTATGQECRSPVPHVPGLSSAIPLNIRPLRCRM